jgi:hypothetical protein
LFLTEMVRGLSLTLKYFFERKVTVSGNTCVVTLSIVALLSSVTFLNLPLLVD